MSNNVASTRQSSEPTVRAVISQPMLLPWQGMFEQIKLCSHFVFYDDVQLPLGGGRGRGFTTRVQIKTSHGSKWLSIPVQRAGRGKQLICESFFLHQQWRDEHLSKIRQTYHTTSHFKNVFTEIVKPIYALDTVHVSKFCIHSMRHLCEALGLAPQFLISSEMGISRSCDTSSRVLAICQLLGATEYITGWGAMNYIDYSLFEESSVRIHYMDYQHRPYPQLNGAFTPYVSILDLLFNVGMETAKTFLSSPCKYWKEWPQFIHGRPAVKPAA